MIVVGKKKMKKNKIKLYIYIKVGVELCTDCKVHGAEVSNMMKVNN